MESQNVSSNLLREIWERRSLIILFAFNDIRIRYRNSILGFFWSFLEPLLMLAVLYFIFTTVIKNNIENYPIFLLLGLVIWYMFSRSTSMGLSSLLDRAGIIEKVYFRKEIIVISACLTAFIMMVFEFGAFGIFIVAFRFVPPITSLLLPLLLIDLFLLSLGISLLLSVLNVYFRDVKFIWQILLQLGFFLSPIIYNLKMFPDNIKFILELNPIVPILDMAHGLVLYDTLPTIENLSYVIGVTALFLVTGIVVFKIKGKTLVEEL